MTELLTFCTAPIENDGSCGRFLLFKNEMVTEMLVEYKQPKQSIWFGPWRILSQAMWPGDSVMGFQTYGVSQFSDT
jgi:hypothetical protein